MFSTYNFSPSVNGYVVESYAPSRVKVTKLVPLVYDKFLTLIPLLLFVAIILGFVSYREFVFVSNLTTETDVPCISTAVITSFLTKPVTRSIITMFGGCT